MATIDKYFNFARLAQAAYGELSAVSYGQPDLLSAALAAPEKNANFSTKQAEQFTNSSTGYALRDHTPNDLLTGFSASLFESNTNPGEFTLAIRGTDLSDWRDLLSDTDLATTGLARDQIISMYRYYKQLITPSGQTVTYSSTELLTLAGIKDFTGAPLTTSVAYLALLAETSFDTGLGKLSPTTKINVVGHSLGGNLTMAFVNLFPNAVAHAYTFNGAGLGGAGIEFIDRLTGVQSSVANSLVTNLVADPNDDFTAGVGTVLGETKRAFIEKQSLAVSDHSIVLLTDSLALQSLFEALDPALSLDDINTILKAASADPVKSLEVTLDRLRTLFEQDYVYGVAHYTASSTLDSGSITSRDDYYTNLYTLQDTIKNQPFTAFKIDNLAGKSASQLTQLAEADPAYRYALIKLNPFAITGASTLYDTINSHGELDFYEPASGVGVLTEQYLKDRAVFLANIIAANTADQIEGDNAWLQYAGSYQYFEDNSALPQTRLYLGADDSVTTQPIDNITQIKFGGWLDDTLTGGSKWDRLYGGFGDDILTGKGGNDYLEGGAGDDTYLFNDGDGYDTILDSDGAGVIRIGGVEAKGSNGLDPTKWKQLGDNVWVDQQNNITYTRRVVDGETQLFINKGTSNVLVKGWAEDELGIVLGVGTLATSPVSGPLIGTATDNFISDDVYDRAPDSAATLDARIGAQPEKTPSITGSDAGSLIEGGAGHDVVSGGAGDDRIYADREIADLAAYITAADIAVGSGLKGEWLSGGLGDDTVVGGADNDTLFGGGGKDLIVGGAGDDVINGDDNYIASSFETSTTGNIGDPWGTFWSDVHIVDYAREVGNRDVIYGGSGNDIIHGLMGDDILLGESGNDVIAGGGGADIILGGDGDDKITGEDNQSPLGDGLGTPDYGNDYIDGGDGNDFIQGEDGADTLIGGAGNDQLWGDSAYYTLAETHQGDDLLDGGAGDDQLVGGGGNDTLLGGAGDDTLWGNAGDDLLDGSSGKDKLYGGAGDDTYVDVDAGDVIADVEGKNTIILANASGVSADIAPTVSSTADATLSIPLSDGTSIDLQAALYGMNATLQFANGDAVDLETWVSENLFNSVSLNLNAVILPSGEAIETAYGGAGADQIQGGAGNDSLKGYGGDDIILGKAGNDTLEGGTGNDHLQGDAGDDALYGGDGADTLLGVDGDDALSGGAGNDELQGGAGSDALSGDSGNDMLFGQQGNDVLDGGAGDDVLQGNAGDDVYLFSLGNGRDVIWEEGDSAGDLLRFGEDITAADITVSKTGSDLVLSHANGDDQITIANWYSAASYRLASFEFSDGTVWNGVDTGNLGLLNLHGTSGNDAIYGGSQNESLYGLAGNDQLYGNDGNDFLSGGAGNDSLVGGNGADSYAFALGDGADVINGDYTDTLRFGADISSTDISAERVGYDLILRHQNGVDSVKIANWYSNSYYQLQQVVFDSSGTAWSAYTLSKMGTDISNQYALNLGDGAVSIEDWGGVDSLTFGPDIDEADIAITRLGQDLRLSHVNGMDYVTIKDWFNDLAKQVETISFSTTGTILTAAQLVSPFLTLSGTAGSNTIQGGNAYGETLLGLNGNDTLYGGDGNDSLTGGQGNDQLYGGEGFDTYYFNQGDGQDTLIDTGFGYNALIFGPGLLDLVSVTGGFNQDTVYSFGSSADSVRVRLGALVTPRFVTNGTSAADTMNGSAYSDVMYGLDGNDTLIGGANSDWLYGGDGDDVLDGNVLTGSSDDQTYGSGSDDYLVGGKGNDTLYGNSRNDYYYFNLGDGNDVITEGSFYSNGQWFYSNSDQLIFGKEITPENIVISKAGSDLLVQISASDSITVKYWFSDYKSRVDSFRFDDGSIINAPDITRLAFTVHGTAGDDVLTGDATWGDVLYGEAGNDTLDGQGGDDALYGGSGDDLLSGASGNDEYFFERGDGQDVITESSGIDKVRFGSTIGVGEVSMSRNENNLVLAIAGATDSLTIRGYMSASANIVENFIFADGRSLPSTQAIQDSFLNIRGTSGDDEIDGSAWANVVYGGDGNDVLRGLEDDDVLYGDAGNDSLDGGAGVDVLIGGMGDDVLIGGTGSSDQLSGGDGNDIYIYSAGGVYSVSDTGGDDSLVLDEEVRLADLSFQQWGNDLFISFAGAGSAFINDQLLSGSFRIERLAFVDGSALGLLDIQFVSGNALIGTAEDSILIGSFGDDTLNGGAGNDWLDGSSGRDTMTGGTGNDFYSVDDRYDVVTELASEGTDTVSPSIAYTLGSNVENLILSGTASINGTGNALNNVLIGNSAANTLTGSAGNDWLDGKGGTDKMLGGTGDDTYVVDVSTETVTERSSEGTDSVLSSATYTLSSNVENLVLAGTAAINGTGNALNNVLTGNSAANTLSGGAGVDTMIGGAGDDTYVVDNALDVVTENDVEGSDLIQSSVTITLAGSIENLTLTGIKAINGTGNVLDNVLTGNSAANTLTGGAGNDRLDGKTGADKMLGGTGDDTYVVDVSTDVVTEYVNEGIDTVETALTHTLGANIENLTLTGTTAINGNGNTLDNVLKGNSAVNSLSAGAGNDTLDSMGGADTLTGGAGNDTYIMGRGYGTDTVVENDATAGNTDIAQFLSGISIDQIWFSKAANNLEVSVIGTSDKLVVKDWYLGTTNHVEQFKTADGKMLLDSQVESLVNAMASFSPPAAGQTTLPPSYQSSLNPVIAANWQ